MNQGPEIIFILKGYPRISETFISTEILGLEQMGFKIRIISMRHPREPFVHDHIKQIRARVDYLPAALPGHLARLVRHNLQLAMTRPRFYAKALGLALKRWTRSGKIATFKHLLQAGFMVNSLVPGDRPLHFHAHFAHSPTSVALFAGILSGMPFSFFAHAKDIYTQNPAQLKEKLALAAFTVTCTRYNLARLKTLCPGARLHCVYHGINQDFFKPCKKTRPDPCFQILTVARHVPKKGLDLVIRAMAQLKDKGLSFHLNMIGQGELTGELAELIKSLELNDHVRLLGTLAHEQVISHYARADLFMLGCRIAPNMDRDGIPNVLAEAMAMGVPVVVPGVSGIPELVVHEKSGILVPPEDPRALALAAERVMKDPTLREQLIQGGRKKVRECFDRKKLIKDLAAVYKTGMGLE